MELETCNVYVYMESNQTIRHSFDFKYRALDDYYAQVTDELDLKKDQKYAIMQTSPSGWWYAVDTNGQDGWVPSNYLEIISNEQITSINTNFESIATANYKAKDEYQLDLIKGKKYTIIQKLSNGWWYGVNEHGENGWVDSNFLERIQLQDNVVVYDSETYTIYPTIYQFVGYGYGYHFCNNPWSYASKGGDYQVIFRPYSKGGLEYISSSCRYQGGDYEVILKNDIRLLLSEIITDSGLNYQIPAAVSQIIMQFVPRHIYGYGSNTDYKLCNVDFLNCALGSWGMSSAWKI